MTIGWAVSFFGAISKAYPPSLLLIGGLIDTIFNMGEEEE